MSDIFKREDGSYRDYKTIERNGELEIATSVHFFPPNQVNIQWYSYDGKPVDESFTGPVAGHMFDVTAPGIHKELVHSVEFPPVSYMNSGIYEVKITCRVLED